MGEWRGRGQFVREQNAPRECPASGARGAGSIGDERYGRGVFEDLANPPVREPWVEAGICAARLKNAQLRAVDPLGIARQQDRDDGVAAAVAERGCHGVRLMRYFRVSGETPFGPPVARWHIDGDATGPSPGGVCEELV
jgi:hypothetical protein